MVFRPFIFKFKALHDETTESNIEVLLDLHRNAAL